MQTSTKRNEHPGCNCFMCRRGRSTKRGHFTTKQVNKKIRHTAKQNLKTQDDPDAVIVSTPYTD
jgi:hypothetical protein